MQTTLLGGAIAFIVALTAALIGPHFVEWNQFRPQFEAAAARVVGVPVRVTGDMRATLLPVPSLQLKSVEVGGGDGLGRASAENLSVEFNLGALMRGEWRASELTINGLALDFGLDWRGRIDWPAGIGGVDLSTLAIDRLNVTGRIMLHDGASRTTLALDDVRFSGDVRALAGALRGDGSASIGGVRYPFRIASNPTADGRGSKLHAVVSAPAPAPLIDLDGELRFAASRPQFDGALTLERRAAGERAAGQPWRVAMQLKADPATARLGQLEVSYGAELTAAKFSGSGDMRFGAAPRLQVRLAARQLDADRIIAAQGGGAAAAWPAMRALAAALPAVPLPMTVEASADTVTLGGRPLQGVSATLGAGSAGWTIDRLTALAPGATEVTIRDATVRPGDSSDFSGTVAIATDHPETFAGWLRSRGEEAAALDRPLRASGRLSINAARLEVEDLDASLGGEAFAGRLVLSGLDNAAGSRLDVALRADRLDLDAAASMLRAAGGEQLPWPHEADIALDIARAVVAGQEVRPVALRLAYGPDAIRLDRLTFGAGDGVAVEGKGSFDRAASTGQMTLAATAPTLARFAELLKPLAPGLAERLKAGPAPHHAARLALAATLGRDAARPDRGSFHATLDLDAAPLTGHATLSAAPPLAAVGGIDLDALAQSAIDVEARLGAAAPGPLLALLGLDGSVAAGAGPALVEASVSGPARQPLRLTAKLAASGLEATAKGTAEPFAAAPAARLALALRQADLAPLLRLTVPLAVSGAAQIEVSGGRIAARDIDLLAAGTRLRGQLTWGRDATLDGDIGLDHLSIPAVFGYAMGGSAAGDDLAQLRRLQDWRGAVAFRAQRAVLPGGTELRPLTGVIRADGRSLTLDALKGAVGGGELTGDLDTRRSDDGILLSARMSLAGADGTALRYRALALPAGRTGVQMTLASQGRSAAALLGTLSGSGSLRLDNSSVNGLNPHAFDVALALGEGKQTVSEDALKAAVMPALSAGVLAVKTAEVAFNIKDGQLRAGPATLDGAGAQAIVSGSYDIIAGRLDIRAALASTVHGGAASRPDLALSVQGTPAAPRVSADLSSLASWLALRSIERETQRLDAIERGTAARAVPPQAVAPLAAPPPLPPSPQPGPEPSATPRTPPPQAVAPLPPPVEVRPAPGAARAAPKASAPTVPPPLALTPQRP